jgi:hypothetical protein
MQERAYQQGGVVSGLRRRLLADANNTQRPPAGQAGAAVTKLRQSGNSNSNPAPNPNPAPSGKPPQAPAPVVSSSPAPAASTGPNPAYVPPGVQWDKDANGVPDSIQAPSGKPKIGDFVPGVGTKIGEGAISQTDPGELIDTSKPTKYTVEGIGRINGMLAGQAIEESRQRITKRDGVDPISGKKQEVGPSPLVRQATALRDANRILESRNAEQAARDTASLPAIGSVPETPQTAISAPATSVSSLRQSIVQPTTPTFESLTPRTQPAQPDRVSAILDETQANIDANEKKKAEDRLFAGTPEQRSQEAETRKVSSLRERYLNIPLAERQRRARAEAARRSAQGY